MPQVETNDLISRFKTGDTSALESLYRSFYQRLCFFANRLLQDSQAAEDIVEDTFIKLWQRHTDFENTQNIKAFLYISTRNACLNTLKQVQRDSLNKKQVAYLTGDQEAPVVNEIIRAEVLEEIMRAINSLPGQCQKIFKMSFIEGLKNQAIADLLSISVHTVKNQKVRALQLLKVRLRLNNLYPLN